MSIVKRIAQAAVNGFKTGAAIIGVSMLVVGIGTSFIDMVKVTAEKESISGALITLAALAVIATVMGAIVNSRVDSE